MTDHNLFIESLPYMFENEPSKFLITHYLWGGEEKVKDLIVHLRLYDLIRRIYTIEMRSEPSKELIIEAIKNIQNSKSLKKYFKKYILNGQFPDNSQLRILKN